MTKEMRAKFKEQHDSLMSDIAVVLKKHGLEGEPRGLRVAFPPSAGGPCAPDKVAQLITFQDEDGNIQTRTICV